MSIIICIIKKNYFMIRFEYKIDILILFLFHYLDSIIFI